MHIGFLIYGDIHTISGGYLYDRKLIEYLENQGDTVSIISLRQNNYFRNILINEPGNILNDLDLDILVQDELIHPSIYRTNKFLKKRLPIVTLVHLFKSYSAQSRYINWLYRRIETKYLLSVDGIVLNSRNTRDQAKALLGGHLPDNIVAVPAGNNFGLAGTDAPGDMTYSTEHPLRILYIGNVTRQKGLHVLLDAMSKLARDDYQVTVIGRLDMEPGYVKKIRQFIKNNGLGNHVTISGPSPHVELPEQYRTHHVLVLPSCNEAYGIVFLEAMQFGLPVIGTTLGGAGEIIQQGVNGYLIQPGDSSQLADYLSKMKTSPEKKRSLSENAIKTYGGHPVWNETGGKVREFLMKIKSAQEKK